jgi:3-methyladenine DNA glycosylase AlkD
MAAGENLWEQRISIISTFHFIRKDDFSDSFEIAKMLLNHKHDLIHKAVGWMLREIGKRNPLAETEFLVENDRYMQMPRTMLRYAIEKYPEKQRQAFLKGEF